MDRIIMFPLQVSVKDAFNNLKQCTSVGYKLTDDEINTVMYALSKQIPVNVNVLKPDKKNWKTFYSCSKCGHEIHDEIKYCSNCGQKLELKR